MWLFLIMIWYKISYILYFYIDYITLVQIICKKKKCKIVLYFIRNMNIQDDR